MNVLREFHSLERQLVKESVLSLLNTNTFEEHVFTLVENYIYEYVQEFYQDGDYGVDQQEDNEIINVWNEYLSDDEEAIDAGQNIRVKSQYTTRFQLKHGVSLSYYPNGERNTTLFFNNGQRHGPYQSWYETGQIRLEGQYENGKHIGTWFSWYPNGNLKYEQTIVDVDDQHFVFDGWRHVWYENGQKDVEQFYVNGKLNGLSQQWNDHGVLLYQTEWVDGKKHGVHKEWRNGTLQQEVLYQYDVLHGPKRTWYESGQLKSEETYVSGKKDGPFILWYENGQLQMTCSYLDGTLDGLQQTWTQNGELVMSHTWDANNTDIDPRVFGDLFVHVWNHFFDN